ncbi:hypothetical protein MMC25_000596 [Agyrium rufum]|nr:hypothetical protein [Agyrium rufum]
MSQPVIWGHPPATYTELVKLYNHETYLAFSRGDYLPYVWPHRALAANLILLYLLLPPFQSRVLFCLRYPLYAFLLYQTFYAVKECRGVGFAVAYGIGMINVFGCILVASFMIVRDARTEFARIEPVKKSGQEEGDISIENGHPQAISRPEDPSSGPSPISSLPSRSQNELRQRQGRGSVTRSDSSSISIDHSASKQKYQWQGLPGSFIYRLFWTVDYFINFRLMGWKHQVSTTPSPPQEVLSSLDPPPPRKPPFPTKPDAAPAVHPYPTRAVLLNSSVITFLFGYISLDVLKNAMMADPYFWGMPLSLSPSPPAYLPELVRSSYSLVKGYRLLISLAGINIALLTIFSLSPLIYGFILGPSILGHWGGEPWMFTPTYGPYSVVLEKGLAGWWGSWWHQIFRAPFSAPGKWISSKMGWPERSVQSQITVMLGAFLCSGIVHAAGSWTSWPETQPFRGPFLFFILQSLGIAINIGLWELWSWGLKKARLSREKVPRWVGKVGNFVYVHTWFYIVAPLLADDFAAMGVWLFEPIPFSIIRGVRGEGWFVWKPSEWIGWYQGEKWWQSGIKLI